MDKQTLTFVLEKETKGSVRYAEQGNGGVVGTLYVRKHVFKTVGTFPQTLYVSIDDTPPKTQSK